MGMIWLSLMQCIRLTMPVGFVTRVARIVRQSKTCFLQIVPRIREYILWQSSVFILLFPFLEYLVNGSSTYGELVSV